MSDVVARVRKLLELSKSSNEHEAAAAAGRAAHLMAENQVTEAMLAVQAEDDPERADVPEAVVDVALRTAEGTKRVAWRASIAGAAARAFGCEWYYSGASIHAVGAESATQTWSYVCAYLFAEVERLTDDAWLKNGKDLVAVGELPRRWKGGHRLGMAHVIAGKLYAMRDEEKKQRGALAGKQVALLIAGDKHATTSLPEPGYAIAIVDKTLAFMARNEIAVKARYAEITKGWKTSRSIGTRVQSVSAYQQGRKTGETVDVARKNARQLGGGS